MKHQSILVLGAIFASGIFGVIPEKAVAYVTFDDGQIHNINYRINDNVRVDYQAPGMKTTVNLLDGGVLTYPSNLYGEEDSVINVSGGLIGYDLRAYDRSQVAVSGGLIGERLYAYGNSQVAVSGGSIRGRLYAYDNSQVAVSGGSIGLSLWTYGNSQVAISGGLTGLSLFAWDNSQVTLSGGTIGGSGLCLYQSSILTIIGSDFAVDGQPFGYGELTSIDYDGHGRRLTGVLASGDLLDNSSYVSGENAKIVLTPIPAPGALLLGSIGAGLVGWLRRMDVRTLNW